MSLPRVQTLIVKKLGEFDHLNEKEVQTLLQTQRKMSGAELEKLLMDDYKINEFQILVAKAKAFGLNPFNGRRYIVNERTFEKLDEDFCVENEVIPVGTLRDYIIIAVANPFDLQLTRKIQEMTKCRVSVLLALKSDIENILNSSKKKQDVPNVEFGDVVEALHEEFQLNVKDIKDEDLEDEESAPIIQLANRIIEEAYYIGASDIHIEPFEKDCRVRIRVDGVCQQKAALPVPIALALVTRLKVMANLDIAEKRVPQDGRIVFSHFTKKPIDIDLRMSTAPLNHGEGVVMRILDKQKATVPLQVLGFEPENMAKYKEVLNRSFGMILHCGPTGSGKTTTLYSALNVINSPEIVIRTAEDPIEYSHPGLCQVQMNPKIGLTFASALRSFLRQDPDVILVGEIRDMETATIAVEAALTGHLLFSTLHTNDAPSSISRLIEMGIEPFMVSASLICICAQRLMRRVCNACKQGYTPEGREKEILERGIKWSGSIFQASRSGCPTCGRSGYKGRIGIHELLVASERLIAAINKESESIVLKRIGMMEGMKTLHQDSLTKVRNGLTTMAEAISTVPPDMEDLDEIIEEQELEVELKSQRGEERRAQIEELKKARAARKDLAEKAKEAPKETPEQ